MFISPLVKIDEHGISILKKTKIQTHFNYEKIKSCTIHKGHQYKNWFISFTLSITLANISFVWLAYSIIHYNKDIFQSDDGLSYIFLSFILPFVLLIGGIIWFYFSLKLCTVMNIKDKDTNKAYSVRLKEFETDGKLNNLITFLKSKIDITIASEIQTELLNISRS